jgi:hypothetical protein
MTAAELLPIPDRVPADAIRSSTKAQGQPVDSRPTDGKDPGQTISMHAGNTHAVLVHFPGIPENAIVTREIEIDDYLPDRDHSRSHPRCAGKELVVSTSEVRSEVP